MPQSVAEVPTCQQLLGEEEDTMGGGGGFCTHVCTCKTRRVRVFVHIYYVFMLYVCMYSKCMHECLCVLMHAVSTGPHKFVQVCLSCLDKTCARTHSLARTIQNSITAVDFNHTGDVFAYAVGYDW
eukprot:Tamp_39066.p1 GENE.Tamp_39066~~Tamp_39066.p1  ORF type:complete len:126 (-),score=14.24 Tamp_39066:74-451(-)